MRTPASMRDGWWNRWAAAHAQLFASAGTNRRTRTPRRAARSILRIIEWSVTYGLTTSSVRRARSRRSAIASVIGQWRPGALWRTTAGTASLASVSGEEGVELVRADDPPSHRYVARNTSCSCETTGPVARRKRSWNRPSWKWSSIPAPPTQPTRPSTTSVLRWLMCPS
jgi:hypothetical protein